MRIHLPGYLMKWMLTSALTLAVTAGFGSHSSGTRETLDIYALLAAGCAIAFACSVIVLFVTAYIYVYLSRNER